MNGVHANPPPFSQNFLGNSVDNRYDHSAAASFPQTDARSTDGPGDWQRSPLFEKDPKSWRSDDPSASPAKSLKNEP